VYILYFLYVARIQSRSFFSYLIWSAERRSCVIETASGILQRTNSFGKRKNVLTRELRRVYNDAESDGSRAATVQITHRPKSFERIYRAAFISGIVVRNSCTTTVSLFRAHTQRACLNEYDRASNHVTRASLYKYAVESEITTTLTAAPRQWPRLGQRRFRSETKSGNAAQIWRKYRPNARRVVIVNPIQCSARTHVRTRIYWAI